MTAAPRYCKILYIGKLERPGKGERNMKKRWVFTGVAGLLGGPVPGLCAVGGGRLRLVWAERPGRRGRARLGARLSHHLGPAGRRWRTC